MKNYSLEETVRLYNTIRTREGAEILFKWLYHIYGYFYLPSIDNSYKKNLQLTKTKLAILDVIIDDLADNFRKRNYNLLKKIVKIIISNDREVKKKNDHPYINVVTQIWDDCFSSIKKYPRYKEFKEIFFFDLLQVFDAALYGCLANTFNFHNPLENRLYIPNGTMVILHLDMDLMCSPKFDIRELWKVRQIMYYTQEICHIGNLLNTYYREIEEQDLASPIISKALRENLITEKELKENPEKALNKIKKLEKYYKNIVKENLVKIDELGRDVQSINIKIFKKKIEKVFNEFLKRQKYWEIKNTKNP